MRYALNLPPFTEPARLLAIARDAEASGWDGVFLWDHLQWSTRVRPDVHDPWVLLGAIAASTERVRIGTLVTPLPRRRPWVVAKHITTLDHLSGGRVTFGAGLGAPSVDDFSAFGDEGDERRRARLLDDGLELLDALLRGGPVDHRGPAYGVEAELRPRPRQRPRPPIWVAGVLPHPRPLRRAMRWDGVAPIGQDGPLTPADVAGYLGDAPRRRGWDIVVSWNRDIPPDEYADAGVTWLTESRWPFGDWVDELHDRARSGPLV